jgi:hypothetical protein
VTLPQDREGRIAELESEARLWGWTVTRGVVNDGRGVEVTSRWERYWRHPGGAIISGGTYETNLDAALSGWAPVTARRFEWKASPDRRSWSSPDGEVAVYLTPFGWEVRHRGIRGFTSALVGPDEAPAIRLALTPWLRRRESRHAVVKDATPPHLTMEEVLDSNGTREGISDYVRSRVAPSETHLPLPTSVHGWLHRLWSKAVGSPGYDKSEWLAFERLLVEAGFGPDDGPRGGSTEGR